MNKSLLALALGGFGIGLTEFMVMGLVPDIAQGLQVSVPAVGHVISAYALGVVVGAPCLTILLSSRRPKTSLLVLMLLFSLFNGLSALAPTYAVLVGMRFLAGLPHGAFFGIGAVVASRLVPKGKEASAVAVMFAGLTIANIVGVPAATYVGHQYHWHLAFWLVGAVGLLAMAAIALCIPSLPTQHKANLKEELRIFLHANLWFALAITCIGTSGFFAWMSYIAPLLIHESHLPETAIPYVMVVAGLGMTVGIFLGGKLADRFSPLKTIIVLMATLTVVLLLNWALAASAVASVLLAFLTGAIALGMCPAVQILLMSHSREAEMLGASLAQSCFNIANALGAFLGSLPLVLGYSYASPSLAGSLMSVSGACIGLGLLRREQTQNASR